MGNTVVLPQKHPDEDMNIYVDMSSLLASGEVVGAAVVTAALLLGESSVNDIVIEGAATVSQNVVTQRISGGEVGTIYCVRIAGTTNQSNVVISLGNLAVTSDNPYGS